MQSHLSTFPPAFGAVLRPTWLAFALACCAAGSLAAEPLRHFENLSVRDGLPHGRVFEIDQDAVGFLWFATQNGLARFDGHGFRIFRHDPRDPTSLPNDYVTALAVGPEERLWVGSVTGQLATYEAHRGFDSLQLPIADGCSRQVDDLVALPDGSALVHAGQGIFSVPPSGQGPRLEHELSCDEAHSLVDSPSGVWLTGPEATYRWAGDRGFEPVAEVGGLVCPGSTDFLLSGDELFRLSPLGLEPVPDFTFGDPVWTCRVDRSGTLWLAPGLLEREEATLVEIEAHTGSVLRRHRADALRGSPRSAAFLSLFEDRRGVLWFGGLGRGVERLDLRRRVFERFEHHPLRPDSLAAGSVVSFADANGDGTWVGFLGGGLQRFDAGRRIVEHHRHRPGDAAALPSDIVWALLSDRRGQLWVGTELGLGTWTPRGFQRAHQLVTAPAEGSPPETTREKTPDGRPQAMEGRILTLFEDSRGTLWAGGSSALYRLDADWDLFREASIGPGHYPILAIEETDDGSLWLGLDGGGLRRLPLGDGPIREYRHISGNPSGLGHDVVSALVSTSPHHLWVATLGGGLARLDLEQGTFHHHRTDNGLGSNAAKSLVHHGSTLWIATDRSLDRLDLEAAAEDRTAIRSLDARSELLDIGFATKSGHASPDGHLWFGGPDGLITFAPPFPEVPEKAPPPVLTELEILHERVGLQLTDPGSPLEAPLHLTESLTLDHRQRVLSLGFAALDFAAPSSHRFRYRLEGFDDQWIETDASRRTASYSNLAPGRYAFSVQASTDGERWSESSRPLVIEVRPPPWRSPAAYGLYAFLLVGAAGLWLRHLRAEAHRQRELAEAKLAAQARQVEALKNLLPICASCKRIRDDEGYWQEVEAYFSSHTETLFSHGLCPTCVGVALEEI